jgi:hypothetical protein
MEVHHHPQVEKKNFKEYFLEFLMIFLAVTMGFFAENIREWRVDKEKEGHYIQNLIADLRADSVNLKLTIADQERENHMLDSALKIPAERLADIKVQDTFFHYVFLYYSSVPIFTPSTNTITQLKAGGFNIMHNQATTDSINYIYQLYSFVEFDNKYNETNYWDVAHKAQSIMRLPEPAVSSHDRSVNMIPDNRRIFLTNDPIAIAQLYNVLGNSIGSFKTAIKAEKDALAKVVRLIAYLRKQYGIE